MKPDQVMAVIHQPKTMAITRLYQRRFIFLPLVVMVFITMMWHSSYTFRTETEILIYDKTPLYWETQPPPNHEADTECINQPGASKAVVVLKTGASEIESKLPIHFQTTFKCTPDFVIFSDLNQTFQGHQIHDSLDELHLHVASNSEELEYYNTLRERQREGKNMTGLATNKAWDLDRYKNVPMLKKSYAMYPEADWFIFIDADTSILFSSILKYLSSLNPQAPLYMGSTAVISDFPFAHGGSGYVVSASAAKLLAEESEEEARKHYKAATDICCGDGNLAHAFDDVGVKVSRIFPNFNGETPQGFYHEEGTWCFGALSFHHVSPKEIEEIWRLEMEFMLNDTVPTHADIFTHFSTNPNATLTDWDNLSHDQKLTPDTLSFPDISYPNSTVSSIDGCAFACAQNTRCMQYRFKPGECVLQWSIRIGNRDEKEGYTSGWMTERLQKWKDNRGPGNCGGKKARWKIPDTKLGPLWSEGGKEKGEWVV